MIQIFKLGAIWEVDECKKMGCNNYGNECPEVREIEVVEKCDGPGGCPDYQFIVNKTYGPGETDPSVCCEEYECGKYM